MTASRLGFKHKKVQRLRRLLRQQSLRDAEGVFVAEGNKLLEEALRSAANVESVFVDGNYESGDIEVAASRGCRIHRLDDGVMERIGATVTPQPLMTVASIPAIRLEDAISLSGGTAVLVDVRDPGNAGTILRSAEAAGLGGAIFCDGSVDPYNPKAVRSSAGAIFHVPVARSVDTRTVLDELAKSGVRRLGTAADASSNYYDVDLTQPSAIFVGNETHGLSKVISEELDEMIAIPIEGRSESLNAGIAMAVVAFEMARQKRVTK